MIYRLLGELEIGDGDRVLYLPGGHPLVLLAALLVNANQRISKIELLEIVWGSAEVNEAQLHKSIASLRSLLDRIGRRNDLVTHSRYGYEIQVSDDDLDTLLFAKLFNQSDQARSERRADDEISHLRNALRLWRGRHPLSNVPSDTFYREIGRLEQRRKHAAVRLFDLELAQENYDHVLDDLDEIAGYYPADGRLCEQLIIVQYRCGHVTDAVATYERHAEALAAATGGVPTATLRALHYAVGSGDESVIRSAQSNAKWRAEMIGDARTGSGLQPEREGNLRKITPDPATTDELQTGLLTQRSDREGSAENGDADLLFRIYVPSGRLYALEAEKLISLFRDWLNTVRGYSVRETGYQTKAGKVYEFFGDQNLTSDNLRQEFKSFSGFLELCAENKFKAADRLRQAGLSQAVGADIIARYGKEIRRLSIDLRHERQRRILAISQGLESDILDQEIDLDLPIGQITALVEALVPDPPSAIAPLVSLASGYQMAPGPVFLTLNQQIISAAQSQIIQNVRGTVHLGPQAKELLDLINDRGGEQTSILEAAVHELEDPDARPADRRRAKLRLRDFLSRIGDAVPEIAIDILKKYIEAKMGI